MPENQYYPHATGPGATALTPAQHFALPARTTGFQNGIADPYQLNTAWRGPSVAASMLGRFIVTRGLVDARDNGVVEELQTGFEKALKGYIQSIFGDVAADGAGIVHFGLDTGSVNALVVPTLYPALSVLTDGAIIETAPLATNTGPVTLNPAGLGAKSVVRSDGATLQPGDLHELGRCLVSWDAGIGKFRVIGPCRSELLVSLPGEPFRIGPALTFKTTTPYTKPATCRALLVETLGGGGAGGGVILTGASEIVTGAGGGAGGWSRKLILAPLSSYLITVGAGGVGAVGSNGGSGGTTSFGSAISATGGAGGVTGIAQDNNGDPLRGFRATTPGPGGAGSGGDIDANGMPGMRGESSNDPTLATTGFGGHGGSSLYGGGGFGSGTSGAAGGTAVGFGAGGGGTVSRAGQGSAAAGGNGSPGICLVTELH